MKKGKSFEEMVLEHSIIVGIPVFKFNEAKIVGKRKFALVKTPFDFVAALPHGHAMFFDAKECKDDWYFSQNVFLPKKIHQMQALMGAAQLNHIAGYLVHRLCDSTIYFIHIQALVMDYRLGNVQPDWEHLRQNGTTWPDNELLDLRKILGDVI